MVVLYNLVKWNMYTHAIKGQGGSKGLYLELLGLNVKANTAEIENGAEMSTVLENYEVPRKETQDPKGREVWSLWPLFLEGSPSADGEYG